MIEQRYSYTNPGLNLDQAHSYNLLLQVEQNIFSYIVTSGQELMAWAINNPISELHDPEELKDILTANYKQVITGVTSTGFTLLPTGLYEAGRVADVARLLDVRDNEKVFAQELDAENMIIYKVDKALITAITNVDNSNINYKAKGWLQALANDHASNPTLYLNVNNERVQFAYFNDGKLRFYNVFKFAGHEELAYYSALVAQQIDLTPADTNIIISGDVNRTDMYVSYLEQFFRSVRLSLIELLDIPPQLELHKVLSLAALSLCASSEEN
ncbi:DUF3822 family protein [Mucilaginibacter pallidiroseus]|uniref:DUF3822 family protein n=1 Tax=Mucilaginibacter pallidiroseus TaxID=2599295 RepID=A0A563UIL5_9SPHI|nr:DUF3822 family protein [Mucilaginibacter pallidiroseus]TWR31139.1 DUF3822 family protein [Mucilaginibacter pallidiroseus]